MFQHRARRLLGLHIVGLINLRIPIPRTRFTNLRHRHRAHFAFTRNLDNNTRFLTTFNRTIFRFSLNFTRLFFNTTTLVSFTNRFMVGLVTLHLYLLRVFSRHLILRTPRRAAVGRPVSLPHSRTRHTRRSRPRPTPALLLLVITPGRMNGHQRRAKRNRQRGHQRTSHVHSTNQGYNNTSRTRCPNLLGRDINKSRNGTNTHRNRPNRNQTRRGRTGPSQIDLTVKGYQVRNHRLGRPRHRRQRRPSRPSTSRGMTLQTPRRPNTRRAISRRRRHQRRQTLMRRTHALSNRLRNMLFTSGPQLR